MRWEGYVACMRERRGIKKGLKGNLRGRDNLEGPGRDGRIILRWIFRNWDVGYVLDRSGSG